MSKLQDWQNGGFGIYVHWPFCQAKCPYCDFNSHVSQSIDQDRWARAYKAEIKRVSALTGPRKVDSIFFGGGTPSLMDPDLVNSVIGWIRDCYSLSNAVEITLEANPTSVEAGKFRGFANAGVNRLSMGVQALNDADLKRLGRLHSASEARHAFDIAKNAFERVSFDLIYARQDQSLDAWKSELNEAISMAVDHFSLYQLTIEQGTAFGSLYDAGKLRGLPSEDLGADMYFATQEICDRAGLTSYEVSNHAATGQESRHNLIYWRYGDYAGIGPGAHSRLTINDMRHAIDTPLAPEAWLTQVEQTGNGANPPLALSAQDQLTEFLMMGLRLKEGISLSRAAELTDDIISFNYNDLEAMGLIEVHGDQLRVTDSGRPVLNAILREIVPTT